jgi:hypothetical protein
MKASVACSALVGVLITAQQPLGAVTQRYRCFPIRPGDTVSQIARRLTGDGDNQRAPWFQIFDAERRLVSKRRYDDIHAGWRACIAEARRPAPSAQVQLASNAAEATTGVEEPPARVFDSPSIVEDPVLWWLLSMGFGAAAVALIAVASGRRQALRVRVLGRFGDEFIQEFARPWAHYRGAGPAPQAQLRIMPRRARVEILIAPPKGRTYPNLSDHRRNVEYDVARVTAALHQESFAIGQPYAEGEWVVLPFHFTGVLTKEGVR